MKIMYIKERLSETAFDWFELYMREYYEKSEADMQIFTKQVFSNYNSFVLALKNIFGIIDEEREAERKYQ